MEINNLVDLKSFRSSPQLSRSQIKKLLEELDYHIRNLDWITIGITASKDYEAIEALKSISKNIPQLNLKTWSL